MSAVDAIRPPKKEEKDIFSPKPRSSQPVKQKKEIPPPKKSEEERKHRLMWTLALIFTGIIFIGWLLLFQNGLITSTNSNQSSFFQQLGERAGDLWQTIKTDILKIKDEIEDKNINTEEEKIKELEEKVFPQFTDPTKQ